jgi:hypothetical protein
MLRISSKLCLTEENTNGGLKGHYGKVFHGRYDDTVDVSVIKIDMSEIKVCTKILREADVHPNIYRFYGQETSDHHSITYQQVSHTFIQ